MNACLTPGARVVCADDGIDPWSAPCICALSSPSRALAPWSVVTA